MKNDTQITGKTILLVEDEAIISLNTKISLEKYGYDVITANNGEKALETVDTAPAIDMILMDINLGRGLDGTETARRILEKHDLPVVFLTSHSETEMMEKIGEIASYGYILKDYGANVVNASIQMALKLFQAREEARDKEEELRASREKLNSLFNAMIEMVIVYELVFNDTGEPTDYRLIDCNRAFISMAGMKKEKLIDSLASDFFHSVPPPYLEEYSRVVQTGAPHKFTSHYFPLDKYFIISAVPLKKNGFATIISDITAIKNIQDEVQTKNQELENYLYLASHDLRSPLVNIQGFSRILQENMELLKEMLKDQNIDGKNSEQDIENMLDETIPKTLGFIFAGVTKMDRLIMALLQISRTGRMEMSMRQIDMNRLIRDVIDIHGFQIRESGARITVKELAPCQGDVTLINQLFSNILSNALKYRHRERKPEIEISSKSYSNRTVYTVRDNGIGIASRHMEKIWNVFFQVNPAISESGDGIGLSIVKRIINKHKGRVWIESEEGSGSTFHVELYKNDYSQQNSEEGK